MQSLAEIKALLEARGLNPRKTFGQNFLLDHNLIKKLVDSAAVGPESVVLEIGPGTGTMTEEILARGCRVVAAEIDRGLSVMLRERFASHGAKFMLVEGDCLAGKRHIAPEVLAAIGPGPFTLISNLPYAAATPVMTTLMIEHAPSIAASHGVAPCLGQFVTIQKEVGDRLIAKTGSDAYGLVSVLAGVTSKVEWIAKLPPECFWPRPDVTSAMLAIRPLAQPLHTNVPALAAFTQKVFEQRRKQLGSVLGRDGAWPNGVEPTARAEALTLTQLLALFEIRGAANQA